MTTRLRVSNSGPLANADDIGGAGVPGQILTRVATTPGHPDTVQWGGGGGGSLPPGLFVDKGTSTPVPNQTGSIEAPFGTIAQALAVAQANAQLFISPGDYSPEGVLVLPNKQLTFQCLAMQSFNAVLGGLGSITTFVHLAGLTVFAGQSFYGYGVTVTGNLTLPSAATLAVFERGGVGVVLGAGVLELKNSLASGNIAAAGLLADQSTINAAAVNIDNTIVLTVNHFQCTSCNFEVATALTFAAAGGQAVIDKHTEKTFAGNVTIVNGLMLGSDFSEFTMIAAMHFTGAAGAVLPAPVAGANATYIMTNQTGDWVLDDTVPHITYNGPTRQFLVEITSDMSTNTDPSAVVPSPTLEFNVQDNGGALTPAASQSRNKLEHYTTAGPVTGGQAKSLWQWAFTLVQGHVLTWTGALNWANAGGGNTEFWLGSGFPPTAFGGLLNFVMTIREL